MRFQVKIAAMIEYEFNPTPLIVKRFDNPNRLQRATGLNYSVCFRLMNRGLIMKMVGVDTVSKLCDALQCAPGDLFLPVKARKAAK